ncbi:hypothetical protein NB311A_21191 [Nitrobacter sp. Nb-311A]|uniref:hypothetical protein n=1 Tax=Nitrobacter sp. Nb-311A TaxID=314253 RepID=UPI0000687ABC|nr:hypothetical protein [Nitrobacter sp. Nb-311A]EAQ36494.1 hypothetical protein NB311A_21191 [Nitrobacter sp. Nb-311A]
MKKLALCTLASAAAVSFAQAAAASEAHYYVVLDTATNKCAIADQRPSSAGHTVDDKIYFKTRAEAETGMQAMKACRAAQANSSENRLR